MPIHCNLILENGGTRSTSIEAGSNFGIYDYSGEVGKMVLAICHDMDRGGIILSIDEDLVQDDFVTGEVLERQPQNIIPSGDTVAVPMETKLGKGVMLYSHLSQN